MLQFSISLYGSVGHCYLPLLQYRLGSSGTKGVCNKKWTGRSNTKFSVNIGPTETYYLPNLQEFAEIDRFALLSSPE